MLGIDDKATISGAAEFRSRAWVLDVESQGVLKRPVLKSET